MGKAKIWVLAPGRMPESSLSVSDRARKETAGAGDAFGKARIRG